MLTCTRSTIAAALAACILFTAHAGETVEKTGQNLYLTTNLLDASPGSWVRRYGRHNHTYTTYIAEVTPDEVVIQLIHTHRDQPEDNTLFRVSKAAIKATGLDPQSPDARDATITHNDKTYRTRGVPGRVNDRKAFFI